MQLIIQRLLFLLFFPCLSFSQVFDARFVFTDTVVSENAGKFWLQFQRVNSFPDSVIYDVFSVNSLSTATQGSDYHFASYFRQSNANTLTPDSLEFIVYDDYLIEDTEYVYIVITNSTQPNLAIDTLLKITILPSDTLTTSFFGAASSVVEKDTTVNIKITLSTPVMDTIKGIVVLYAGNATKDIDYQCQDTLSITWAPFTNDTILFPISIIDDETEELNEQINLDLIKISPNGVTDIVAYTLSIIDNDSNAVYISEKSLEIVSIFPNPAENFVKIMNHQNKVGKVKIFSILGEILYTKSISWNELANIDISNWNSGIYSIIVEYDLELKSFNLIKK